ncbi:MAG: hypothetical protein AAGA54_13845 [Myxococcota bacterium]
MKPLHALLTLPLLLACACDGEPEPNLDPALGDVAWRATSVVPSTPGYYSLDFEQADGTQRSYLLFLPPGYDETGSDTYELIMMFHGGGQSAIDFAGSGGMLKLHDHALADDRIVVFPNARPGLNPALDGLWITNPVLRDDPGYAEELLDHLEAELQVDRTFAGGYSNGGRLVHELGTTMVGRFTGLAAVNSYYGNAFSGTPAGPPAGTTTPIFLANALNDTVVPYAGGSWQGFTPAQDAYDAWYADNACNLITRTYNITTATYDATACTFGTFRNIIQFVTVNDVTSFAHHEWPTSANSGYEATNGMINFWDAQ